MTYKPTLGEDLRDTLHAHGILGHILGCEADAESITVQRTMLDSQDRRIDRARRKVVAEREILEVETDEEFEAFLRCGECGGEDC